MLKDIDKNEEQNTELKKLKTKFKTFDVVMGQSLALSLTTEDIESIMELKKVPNEQREKQIDTIVQTKDKNVAIMKEALQKQFNIPDIRPETETPTNDTIYNNYNP